MLKSACLPMYGHLNVHGYWLMRDTRMGRSLGNIVNPVRMTELFGSDAFRCFLLREMHFGADASFNYDALIACPARAPFVPYALALVGSAQAQSSPILPASSPHSTLYSGCA